MKRLLVILCFVAFMGCATTQNTGPKPTPYFSKEEVDNAYSKMGTHGSYDILDILIGGTSFIWP